YTIFECNDEPGMGSAWGIFMMQTDPTYANPPGNQYPGGHLLHTTATGPTPVYQGGPVTFPSVNYPVYELFPIAYRDAGATLFGSCDRYSQTPETNAE